MKIFSFPHVVVYELMNQFKPVELIYLSFCSKKSNAFVKTFSRITEDLEINSTKYGGYEVKFCEQELMDSKEIMTLLRQDTKTHSSLDAAVGLRETTNYICDLFKISVSIVTVYREEDLWMLDFAEQRQEQKLKKVCVISLTHVSAESYSRILNCNTESLKCHKLPPRDYRFDGKLPLVKHIFIFAGFWITREHFLSVDSRYVQLRNTRLTSSDVNELLKLWLNGGFSKLKCLQLHSTEFTDEENNKVYEGIQDRLERVQRKITYKRDPNVFVWDVKLPTDAFHIRREDGVVATVEIDRELFTMVVWPDSNGNRV